MATIKDVARLAGVSHGTVSNVVNGTKTVNSEIVKRVQSAIKELQYQPNAKARSLRISKTNLIGVVLPNITDRVYSQFYSGIESIFQQAGYTILLFITEDKVEREKEALKKLQEQRAEAILLVSCMPQGYKLIDAILASETKLIFVRRKPAEECGRWYVGLDEAALLQNVVETLIQQGYRSFLLVADKAIYSNEAEVMARFDRLMETCPAEDVMGTAQSAQFGKGDFFRICAEALVNGGTPEVILTTGTEALSMVRRAVAFFQSGSARPPRLICLADLSDQQIFAPGQGMLTFHDFYDLGRLCASKSRALLEFKEGHGSLSELLPAVQKWRSASPVARRAERSDMPLRICLLEGRAADAMRVMACRFTGLTGKPVQIQTFSYEELNQRMTMLDPMGDYDIVQINRPWLNECTRNRFLVDLSPYFEDKQLDYPMEILNSYAIADRKLMGIPYMLGAQLLFYRKDMFSNFQYQRQYYEQYEQELRVPRTWEEFDQIARFFTRRYNPDSPLEFGAALGAAATFSVYSYIPRLWELEGDVFDMHGKIVFNSKKAVSALERLKSALAYCDPDALRLNWRGQAQSFFNGQAAMVNMYQSHLMDYQAYENSRIVGKFGIATMPGPASIRGGWVLTINEMSGQVDDALSFLRWFASCENVLPYNLLGGSNPGCAMLESHEMTSDYPWFQLACSTLAHSRPMLNDNAPLQQATFERIAGRQLEGCLLGTVSAPEAVAVISEQLALLSPKVDA